MSASSTDNKFLDFQTSAKYFFDTSAQCFDLCIRDFNSKDMSDSERSCVNACFTKQMVVYGSLVNNVTATQAPANQQ
jgi:hypothetical protein